jgi:hypothetical protein
MKKIMFIALLLLTFCFKSANAQMYIVTDKYIIPLEVDSVFVTSPTGVVTRYEIASYNEPALHDSQLNVILNGVINLGYKPFFIGEQIHYTRIYYFAKP